MGSTSSAAPGADGDRQKNDDRCDYEFFMLNTYDVNFQELRKVVGILGCGAGGWLGQKGCHSG
jgi:hypothetical protein